MVTLSYMAGQDPMQNIVHMSISQSMYVYVFSPSKSEQHIWKQHLENIR